ncbi:hypothetical protein N9R81_00130 [Flavobacteriales bacterium]|nr:hypothetical protein [Flavobacteriales bacterium]
MSNVTYEALSVKGLKEVLAEVAATCQELGIDFFLVGAVARNIWLTANNIGASGTKDIDFGVYIPTNNQYTRLREKLIDEHKYSESEQNAFCLIHPKGIQIDLLPFGEIENEGKVIVEGKGLQEINLDGFKESFQYGKNVVSIEDDEYLSCSIPALAVLKLIAYDDRPERRQKDIKDIRSICLHYPDLETDNIWENHSDLYDDEREHQDVGIIVLGREMKKIIEENESLLIRVRSILVKALNGESNLINLMIEDSEKETIEGQKRIVELVLEGLK